MKWLSIFARFGIMGAMVIALAYKMNESMTVTDWWEDALLVGAFLSAISFEFIGYLNGHSMEGYWRIGDYVKAGTSAVLLIVYSIVAIVILWDNESLRLLPVVAAIVYFSAPLVDGLGVMVVEQEKKSAKDSALERQEQIKESQHRRDMEARQLEIDAQNALQIQLAHEQAEAEVRVAAEKAKVSIANAEARKAKAKVTETKVPKAKRRNARSETKAGGLSENERLVLDMLRGSPEMSNAEIGRHIGLSGQGVGQIRRRLDGNPKVGELSPNGSHS